MPFASWWAVFFVDHTIQQLRVAGELIPLWAPSRVVQDLVDLQRAMPLRFLQLARCKATTEEYWGFHAANVVAERETEPVHSGLRVARVFDGESPDGRPWFSPRRLRIPEPDRRERLRRFADIGKALA